MVVQFEPRVQWTRHSPGIRNAAKPSETTTTSPSIQGYKQDRRKLPEPILAKNSIEYELLMLELQTEYKTYARTSAMASTGRMFINVEST